MQAVRSDERKYKTLSNHHSRKLTLEKATVAILSIIAQVPSHRSVWHTDHALGGGSPVSVPPPKAHESRGGCLELSLRKQEVPSACRQGRGVRRDSEGQHSLGSRSTACQ